MKTNKSHLNKKVHGIFYYSMLYLHPHAAETIYITVCRKVLTCLWYPFL